MLSYEVSSAQHLVKLIHIWVWPLGLDRDFIVTFLVLRFEGFDYAGGKTQPLSVFFSQILT